MKSKEKITAVYEQIETQINDKKFGKSGEMFLTTRALAKNYGISLEYANKVMGILCRKRLISLLGNHFYLTYKKADINSPFMLKYSPKKRFGFIISDLNNVFVSELTQAVANEIATSDYSLNIVIDNNDIESIIKMLFEQKVSGIFVDPIIARRYIDILKKCPISVVSIGYDLTNYGIDSITVDNFRAGKTVADHFCEIKCTDFAYIGFKRRTKPDERLDGYKTNIEKSGHKLKADKIILIERDKQDKYDTEDLYRKVKKLVWKSSSFEKIGIFCYHDLLAYDVITALTKIDLESLDRKIPQNIAIAGFDNLSVASLIRPRLTTVSYPTKEMAQKAVSSMIDGVMNLNHKESKKDIGFSLIRRETT